MKLTIQNKLVSIGGSSKVTDENGKNAFYVKGKAKMFSASKKKWIKDANKKKLFLVRNKVFHGLKRSCLIYDNHKKLIAKVNASHIYAMGFEVEGTEEKIEAKSSNNRFPLTITMGGKTIGTISTQFKVTDTFILEAKDPEDAGFLVALVIAVDNIRDAAREH